MANAITGIRIVCALILLFCPTFSALFYALYLICGVSDVLDGIAARRFGTESKLGAQLDTIADAVFVVITIIKVVRAISLPAWLLIWIGCIAVIKIVNMIVGFVLYKQFVSEHTVMNKICGVLLFAIPLCIGLLSLRPALLLMLLTCAAATFSAVQEGYYIRIGRVIS